MRRSDFFARARSRTHSLLATILALGLWQPSVSAALRLIDMPQRSLEEIQAMRESGVYEILEIENGRMKVLEDTELLEAMPMGIRGDVQMLRGTYRIDVPDLDELYAPLQKLDDLGRFHTLAEVRSEVDSLAAAHPDWVKVETIGTSIEGRPIRAVRVGLQDGVERPTGIFMSMIHAREWITTEFGMAFLNKLVEAQGDLRSYLEKVTVYVIPVLNPDGFLWSQTEQTMWRGNRRKHPSGRHGVDLNRNFTVGWGIGSSSVPGSQTYKGEAPLSEPETKAFDDFVAAKKPALTMTWHAYGRMVLLPYGYRGDRPARWDIYQDLGPKMGSAARYRAGAISDLIGLTGGSTDDHFLETHGAFVATLELGTRFIPRPEDVDSIIARAMPAAEIWLKAIPRLHGLDPRQPPNPAEATFRRLHGAN